MLVVFMPHGMPVEHFDPAAPAGPLDLGSVPGVNVLEPLTPYASQMNLLRGIEYVGYDNHPAIRGTLTNGAGASVEHVVAAGLGTKAHCLGAVPWRPNDFGPDSQLLHDGTDWVRPEASPLRAAETLLSGIGDSSGDDDDDAGPTDADFRRAALSLTIEEVDALRKQVGDLTREQTKLSTHLESLQHLLESDDGGDLPTGCDSLPSMPALDEVAAGSDNGANSGYFIDKANFSTLFQAQLDVAAYALLCGSAKVMALQTMYVNAQIDFGFMGEAGDHHDPLSHSIDGPGRESFARAQRWLIEQLADRVLRVLSGPDPDDPEHTVLDNTLVYLASEIADGNAHNCRKAPVWIGGQERITYVPIMTFGGASGALKTGQIFDFDNRPHADLLMTLCRAMGTEVSNFGPNSSGVIEELLA